jgi:hypothetical protein
MQFDGTDRVIAPMPISESYSSDVTISAWVYSTAAAGDGDRYIFSRWLAAPNNTIPKFYLKTNATNIIAGTTDSATPTPFTWTCTRPFTLNRWTHVCTTTHRNGKQRIYLDGVLAGGDTDTYPDLAFATGSTEYVVGCGWSGEVYANGWSGYIDDVRLYNREMTADEIMTMYACRGMDNIVQCLQFRLGMGDYQGAFVRATVDISYNAHPTSNDGGGDEPQFAFNGVLRTT